MLTVGFIAIVFVLLALVGVFALMARDQNRRGRAVRKMRLAVRNKGGRLGWTEGRVGT
jgi:uncharacterized membrane protein YvbJ